MNRLERARLLRLFQLEPGATAEDIRKAYRRLARALHPDLNPDPNAQARFLEIREAYERLVESPQLEPENQGIDARAEAERLRRKRMREAYLERVRQEDERRMRGFRRWWFFPFALMCLPWAAHYGQRSYNRWLVISTPDTSWCRVSYVGYREVHYSFVVEGVEYTGQERTGKVQGNMVGRNGMPLREGDVFRVMYRVGDPKRNIVDYTVCDAGTFERSLELCQRGLLEELGAPWDQHPHHLRCLALLLFEHHGWSGLADFAFNNTLPFDNIKNNAWTCRHRLQSKSFKGDLRLCAPPD